MFLPYDLSSLANSQEYVTLIATKVNVNDSWFLVKPTSFLKSYNFIKTHQELGVFLPDLVVQGMWQTWQRWRREVPRARLEG